MGNNVRKQTEKISADCPHCGFSQLESAAAKTTFCRKCGQHYNIEKLLAREAESLKGPSIFDRITKYVTGEKERSIRCQACGHGQVVSSSAQSSMCPGCGSYIDLRDFKITGPFGRSIQTQGDVTVTPKGDLGSGRVVCANAYIEGKIRGVVICTNEAHVKLSGKVLGSLDGQTVIIDRKSDVEFAKPVKSRALQVNGKVSAIVKCDGCVTIAKGGYLEGTVYAKSVNFEQGGIFSGELHIGERDPDQPELLVPETLPSVQPVALSEDPPAVPQKPRATRRRA